MYAFVHMYKSLPNQNWVKKIVMKNLHQRIWYMICTLDIWFLMYIVFYLSFIFRSYIWTAMTRWIGICIFNMFFSLFLQQLMRERQQMASRPFASVTVALETPEEEEELLQGQVEVSHHSTNSDSSLPTNVCTFGFLNVCVLVCISHVEDNVFMRWRYDEPDF